MFYLIKLVVCSVHYKFISVIGYATHIVYFSFVVEVC